MCINSKAQSWSVDVIMGAVIFMVAFLIIYSLINSNQSSKVSELKEEASIVIKQIDADGSAIRMIDNNEVNQSRLNQLKNLSYDELKRELKINGDFCIYLEDDKGNLVLLNNSYKGIGAPTISLSGTPCSQK